MGARNRAKWYVPHVCPPNPGVKAGWSLCTRIVPAASPAGTSGATIGGSVGCTARPLVPLGLWVVGGSQEALQDWGTDVEHLLEIWEFLEPEEVVTT